MWTNEQMQEKKSSFDLSGKQYDSEAARVYEWIKKFAKAKDYQYYENDKEITLIKTEYKKNKNMLSYINRFNNCEKKQYAVKIQKGNLKETHIRDLIFWENRYYHLYSIENPRIL